jgi:hypothetical protein
MRESPHYADAVAMWTLAGSWCCGQEIERNTGVVPIGVLTTLGIACWRCGADTLTDYGLWEYRADGSVAFHDWHIWNGPDAKVNRSREQARIRQENRRIRRCQRGIHDKECPPETCPKKIAKRAASRIVT